MDHNTNGDNMENEFNQSIKCSVHDCLYHQGKIDYCTLDKIKVCLCSPADEKESTMCDSYACKPKKKKKKAF